MLQVHTPNLKMANDSRSDSCVVDQRLFERFFDLIKFVIHITIYLLLRTVSFLIYGLHKMGVKGDLYWKSVVNNIIVVMARIYKKLNYFYSEVYM